MNNTIIKFILICFIFTFITSCSSEEKIAYKTETVVDTSIIKKTVATGSIVPRKEVNIK